MCCFACADSQMRALASCPFSEPKCRVGIGSEVGPRNTARKAYLNPGSPDGVFLQVNNPCVCRLEDRGQQGQRPPGIQAHARCLADPPSKPRPFSTGRAPLYL
jgi:hypothetical protein